MDAPGLPGCFPCFFFPAARSAARRSRRGGFRPGPSSELGGTEEFPLFRDTARSALSSCSRRSATTASSAAIRSPWTAMPTACPAPRSAPPARGSARHADPPAAAHRSQPQSSSPPQATATATPQPPPKRNQRSPCATPDQGLNAYPVGLPQPSREVIVPSRFRPNRRSRSASSSRPCLASRSASREPAYSSPMLTRERSSSR